MPKIVDNEFMPPKFHICILNWNGAEMLDECLQSVFMNKGSNYRVTVIDNNSSNFSSKKIDRRVNIVQLDKNYGFSKGYNLGINKSNIDDDEYIILLNFDATLDEDFILSLTSTINKHGPNYIYGVKILFDKNKKLIWYAGGIAKLSNGTITHVGIRERDENFNIEMETDYVTGCCMILHINIFCKLKGFDESFFMYNEDVDLCLRAMEFGVKCFYIPSAVAYHKVSMSTGGNYSIKKILLKAKSSYLLYTKYYRISMALPLLFRYFIKTLLRIKST